MSFGRSTVADHEAFLDSIRHEREFDEIDHLVADPVIDRVPRRSEAAQRRLESILDEIGKERR